MQISDQGLAIIRQCEGLRLKAYLCPAGVWTVGYGHTHGVSEGLHITSAEADKLLLQDVAPIEDFLHTLRINFRQGQFDALASFIFNVGLSAFRQSTLLRKIMTDASDEAITAEFLRWNKAGGKVLPGLNARRKQEAALWKT